MSTVVHVGFHKTGTTTLQRNVFPRLEGCAYVGPTSPRPYAQVWSALAETLWSADDDAYLDQSLRGFLADVRGDAETLIVSHESLSRYVRDERTPRRLRDLLPDADVIVCVRNQLTMIHSLYHQYVSKGGYEQFESWAHSDKLHPGYVQYDTTVDRYQQVFGRRRVHVVLYEDLRDRPAEFVAAIARIVRPDAPPPTMDVTTPLENTSLSAPSRAALRRFNRWFVRSPLNPHPTVYALPGSTILLSRVRRIDAKVFGRAASRRAADEREAGALAALLPAWAASNARLQDLTGLDLAPYGYPLPDPVLRS